MLKELIQMLVKDPGAMTRFQNGELQLAGISNVEQRALLDILGKSKNEVMKLELWRSF